MNSSSIESKLLGNRGILLGYIRKKVGDADLAEDILHDSLLKALRSAPELRDEEKLLPWFYTIINNSITDLFRRRQTARKYQMESVEESFSPEEERVLCECFKGIIPTLKPEYAELLEELELNGGDPEAVSARLGITRNNLKVRRHRARMQLRERLEQTCRSCAHHGCLDCTCKG